jgi:plastocyanin
MAAAVDIKDFSFTPANVTIKVGGTVTFTNKGAAAHTVSPVSGLTFNDPGQVDPGKTRVLTFTQAGTANYQCNFHTSMKGTITVVP